MNVDNDENLITNTFEGKKIENYYKIIQTDEEGTKTGIDANVFNYLRKILPKDLRGQTALDIGCGDGRWAEYLCKHNADSVIGVDISPDMIKEAKERKEKNNLKHLKLELIQADMLELPFKKKSVDKVISTFSLMYFKKLDDVMKEIRRVLKSDGEVYITTNILNSDNHELLRNLEGQSITMDLGKGVKKLRTESIIQTEELYKQAFKEAGLDISDEEYFKPDGVVISPDYKHKNNLELKKAVFKLIKVN